MPSPALEWRPLAEIMKHAGMVRAARVVRTVLDSLARHANPGVTTRALAQHADHELRTLGATPSFPGYHDFPAVLWASPNEFVHALPDDRHLQEGDLLTLDLGAMVDGYHADLADTIVIGGGDIHSRLLGAAWAVLEAAAAAACPGCRVGKIGFSALRAADDIGCHLVMGSLGHGIGRAMHEFPIIPLTWDASEGPQLEPGMILAIEPVVTWGSGRIETGPDGWSTRTEDSTHVAMFERMVLITEAGPVFL
jgi:methionyl aminopeptidase